VPHTPLGPGGEFDRIRAIAEALGPAARDLGDDCAFLEVGDRTLALSVDASVEGVHFRPEWLTPAEVGWRAAAAALSDLAAVGAVPLGALVAVSGPKGSAHELDVMRGVGAACAACDAAVLGGDLTGGPVLAVTVTVVGEAPRPVRRAGARSGDGVWVTGTLGGARAALTAWADGREPDPGARTAFAHPEPRVAAGRWLAGRGATAMLDLSDGLAGDAGHLARASGVRLEIDLGRVPLGPGVASEAARAGEPPVAFAARGGEDYELLVTLPAGEAPRGCPMPLTRIGVVRPGAGVALTLDGQVLALSGFDHFA
jgi:thiamine-monophosphate kinase